MLVYYGSHILHTAVTYFDVVHVEKGVILVFLREVFRYELKEGFADVSLHAAVKRRIIPDNVTLAVSTWSIILSVFVVGKTCCIHRSTQTCIEHSRISVRWPIYIINSVDKTKFLYTL